MSAEMGILFEQIPVSQVKLIWTVLVQMFMSIDMPWYWDTVLHKYVIYHQIQPCWLPISSTLIQRHCSHLTFLVWLKP
jgi:hypothetical protein